MFEFIKNLFAKKSEPSEVAPEMPMPTQTPPPQELAEATIQTPPTQERYASTDEEYDEDLYDEDYDDLKDERDYDYETLYIEDDEEIEEKDDDDDGDFLISAGIGAATGSALAGGILGGNFLGGLAGSSLFGDDDDLF